MARILITEDERLIAEDLKWALQDHGHKIVGIVASGEEAIKMAFETKPEIIFMDISLDGSINGIDAAKAIQKKIDVYIVFCSAFSDNITRLKASALNPMGYVTKPFEFAEIEQILERDFPPHPGGNGTNRMRTQPDFHNEKIS